MAVEFVHVASISAAACWALAAVSGKRGMENGGHTLLLVVISTAVGTVLFSSILLATSGGRIFSRLTPVSTLVFILSGVVGTALGRLVSYTGIQRTGATVGEAGGATHPLFASLLAFVLLSEPILLLELAGMVIIIVGIVMMSLSKGGDQSGWEPWEILIPLFAAMLFGTAHTLRRYGFVMTDATPVEGTALNSLGAFLVLVLYIGIGRKREILIADQKARRYFALSGLLIPVGLLLSMVAFSLGRVVTVAPLLATVPLFGLLFGYLLLRDVERITPRLVGSICITVSGIVLITIA